MIKTTNKTSNMKNLKYIFGIILISIISFIGYSQNSKNMNSQDTVKNEHPKFQKSTSESNSSYTYGCSFDESNYQEIRKVIKSNFDSIQIEKENFYYIIQLKKNSLKIKFNSTETKRHSEAKKILDKLKKVEKQISLILK